MNTGINNRIHNWETLLENYKQARTILDDTWNDMKRLVFTPTENQLDAKFSLENFEKILDNVYTSYAICDDLIEEIENKIKELDIIRIGDIVKVINTGCIYTTYNYFFDNYELSKNISTRYQCEYDLKNNKSIAIVPIDKDAHYKVLFIAKHTFDETAMIYVIENMENNCVYLINEKGIKLA